MSTPTISRGSPVSERLHETKKILQDVAFDTYFASAILDAEEVDTLEQVAFEVLRLIRSLKNRLAPINRIPPEVLTLIPDFWDERERDLDVIALSHVCQTWRKSFTSSPSLWTDFDCVDLEQTRTYLERSKSSPINLRITREATLSPHDPLLQVIPHATDRLKSLFVRANPENTDHIATHLSHSAPFLECLLISGGCEYQPEYNPVLATSLFNGDLSSLRTLHLECVRTGLIWRNMVNLTSLKLVHMLPGDISIGQLLDFLESAPRLCDIELFRATPTSGPQDGRLVSLACLKSMEITGDEPSSPFLGHLVIPVGAELTTQILFSGLLIEDHLPRSLDNLKNLSNFTEINIRLGEYGSRLRFTGPNGQVLVVPMALQTDITRLVFESLAQFDTSKTEQLDISCIDPPPRDDAYRALLPMKNVLSLTLSRPGNPHTFINALDPGTSSSDVIACPKLEELVFTFWSDDGVDFDIESVITMAAARASRGTKLKSVRFVNRDEPLTQAEESELGKHVSRVLYGPEVDLVSEDGDGSSERED